MKTLNYSIFINASKEKVWNTMLEDATYRAWTAPFNPAGSSFKGNWDKGSIIHFIGVDAKTGKEDGGMYSEVAENKLHEYVSLKHLGEIKDGVEVPWEKPEQIAFENYTFVEKDGGTEVLVEITNMPDEYLGWMNDLWPKALEALKELSENN